MIIFIIKLNIFIDQLIYIFYYLLIFLNGNYILIHNTSDFLNYTYKECAKIVPFIETYKYNF